MASLYFGTVAGVRMILHDVAASAGSDEASAGIRLDLSDRQSERRVAEDRPHAVRFFEHLAVDGACERAELGDAADRHRAAAALDALIVRDAADDTHDPRSADARGDRFARTDDLDAAAPIVCAARGDER